MAGEALRGVRGEKLGKEVKCALPSKVKIFQVKVWLHPWPPWLICHRLRLDYLALVLWQAQQSVETRPGFQKASAERCGFPGSVCRHWHRGLDVPQSLGAGWSIGHVQVAQNNPYVGSHARLKYLHVRWGPILRNSLVFASPAQGRWIRAWRMKASQLAAQFCCSCQDCMMAWDQPLGAAGS